MVESLPLADDGFVPSSGPPINRRQPLGRNHALFVFSATLAVRFGHLEPGRSLATTPRAERFGFVHDVVRSSGDVLWKCSDGSFIRGESIVGFEGSWLIEISTPIGKQEITLAITDRDGEWIGTATQGVETVPFQNMSIEDDRICWSQQITKPMRLTIKFDLIRNGDALSGTARAGILPSSTVQGTKQR